VGDMRSRAQSSRALVFSMLASALLTVVNPGAVAAETYPNGFPTDPKFFPIGVWLQSPARAANYKAIGINTFVGLYEGPTEAQLAELAKHNMFSVATQNDVGLTSKNRHVIRGWLFPDEPDNAQPAGPGKYGPCIPATEVARRTREMKGRDSTRPVMINFGPGMVNEFWPGRGSCTGDNAYYGIAGKEAGILSFDIYPVSVVTEPQVKGKLEYVARGVTKLANLASKRQSVWTVVETTAIEAQGRVSPAQLKSTVWMSLIHGAKGIVYFVHEFKPVFREDAIFRYDEIVDEVKRTNNLIALMAPVLNSPDVIGRVTIQATAPVAAMVKQYNNVLYIFAAATTSAPARSRISIAGINRAQADVVEENRSAPISQGVMEEAFTGYGVHIYAIPLGRN
jgi:hypothetical protein